MVGTHCKQACKFLRASANPSLGCHQAGAGKMVFSGGQFWASITIAKPAPAKWSSIVWLFVCCDMQLAPGMTCVILYVVKTCPCFYAAHKSQQAVRAIFGTQSRAPRSQCREDLKSQPSPQPQKNEIAPRQRVPQKAAHFLAGFVKKCKNCAKICPKIGSQKWTHFRDSLCQP